MPAAMDEILPEVFKLLRERAGMDRASLGAAGVEQAVRSHVLASGAGSAQAYLRRVVFDAAEFQELLEDIVVPETWFFRDMLAFRCLAGFLDARRSPNRPMLRVLSVGCSTGEEVYSLAIALREARVEASRFLVLGVDVSRRSLELAREGEYPSRSFREPDETIAALRERWCERVGESWRVRDELRAGVELKCENLAQPEFLAGELPFDVIFCRNVLIYFHSESRRVAVRHLRRLLSPEGILCTAPAEARIFSEACFASLGSECPLAFRRRDAIAAASPPPAIADRPTALVRQVYTRSRVESNPGTPHARSFEPRDPSYKPPYVRQVCNLSRQDAIPSNRATKDQSPASKPPETAPYQSAAGDDFSGPALLRAAREAADNGRLEEADALCSRLLARDFASAEAHYLRGVVRQVQGQFGEAQRSFEKALYLDPRHYEALVHMMLLAERRGDGAAAANFRRRAHQVALREAE